MCAKTVVVTEIIAPYRIPVFNALSRLPGIDLHVIFLAETDTALRQWHIHKDEIQCPYDVLPSWRLRVGKRNLLFNRGLSSVLKALRPGTIICGGYNYPASWQSLWWARRNDAKFALWTESNEQDSRSGNALLEYLKRYFVSSCDAFVVPGKSSFAYLRSLGASEKLIFTAPNAVDNDFYSSSAAEARANADAIRERLQVPARFILFSGRLVSEKGVFDLLHAYAKLESALRLEVGLVFAGDGSSRRELEQQARSIKPGTILFPGFAQREDLVAFYALADVLVLATHSDPWGLAVNEGMASGLPIIVTSVAGCSADLVEDGWNGYVVPSGNPERLCAALHPLLRDTELRRKMSVRSSERILSYSPTACAAGLAAAALFPQRAPQ